MPSPSSSTVVPRPYLWRWDASRYKRAYLLGGPDEASVQQDIRRALGYLHVEAFVVDAGAAGIRGKVWGALKRLHIPDGACKIIMAAIENVAPAPPGWPDLCGCLAPSGRAFYIEVKAPARLDPTTGNVARSAGTPSKEQLQFLDRMAARGALVGVAWGVEDALAILAPAMPGAKPTFS